MSCLFVKEKYLKLFCITYHKWKIEQQQHSEISGQNSLEKLFQPENDFRQMFENLVAIKDTNGMDVKIPEMGLRAMPVTV